MSLQDWHHVEYLFPVGNAQHVHGENTQIMTEHFMLESYDEDCDATYFDNILVTRASPQRFFEQFLESGYLLGEFYRPIG